MNEKTSTHSGTKSEFCRLFIKTGKIDREFGELYTDLFSKRQESDYEDFLNNERCNSPMNQEKSDYIKNWLILQGKIWQS